VTVTMRMLRIIEDLTGDWRRLDERIEGLSRRDREAGPSGQRLRATDDGPRRRRMYPLTLDGLDAAMRELVR
jgi:hypothetical protein